MKRTMAISLLEGIRQTKRKATLRDHLLYAGLDEEYTEFRGATTACQRLLKEGAPYHDLLGKIVFPSWKKRGRPPLWCGDTQSMMDKVDEPSWTTGAMMVSVVNALTLKDRNLEGAEIAVIQMLAKTSIKRRDAMISVITGLADLADRTEMENANLQAQLDAKQAQLDAKVDAISARLEALESPHLNPKSPIGSPTRRNHRRRGKNGKGGQQAAN